mgnify:CR=1 FL=1
MLESPYLKSLRNVQLENELKSLRKSIESEKVEKIKTVYQPGSSRGFKSVEKVLGTYDSRVEQIVGKNQESVKNLDQMIKLKEVEVLREIKKKKLVSFGEKKEEK